MVRYDWSKLDAGWRINAQGLLVNLFRFDVTELEACSSCESDCDPEYAERWIEAKAQLAKCRVDTSSQQRKHEATHGWRNPPSIYEEQDHAEV